MNFLAIVQDVFKRETTSAPLAIQNAQKAPLQAPVRRLEVEESYHTYDNEIDFGLLPKRIRRIMNLAKEGGYGMAQIEGVKVSGLWARKFVKLYQDANQMQKDALVSRPMNQVFLLVNGLIEKGKL